MRKPKFTPVPHEVIDTHLADLSGPELKILLVILRLTHGWNRDERQVSLSKMVDLSGLSRSACCDAIKSLEARTLVRVTHNSNGSGGHGSNSYEPVFDDDTLVAQEDYPLSAETTTPLSATATSIRNIEKEQIEKELTPPTPSENPPEPTHQDVINRINSEGYGLLGAGARSVVKATDISGLTLEEAVARCQAGLKNHRGVSARPSNARTLRQSRQAVQREDPKPERRSMKQFRTVTTDGHWLRDEWLMSFRERYNSINPATVDADWRDAYGPAIALTDEERAKAFEHILTCDGAWVKSPKNYLRDKEFTRAPRPKPKSDLERMMGV